MHFFTKILLELLITTAILDKKRSSMRMMPGCTDDDDISLIRRNIVSNKLNDIGSGIL